MAISLPKEITDLFDRKDVVKVLSTISKDGVPHVTVKGSLHVNGNGEIVLLELLETSQTNKNLTYSLWYNKKAAIGLYIAEEHKSYLIEAEPYKVLIHGSRFEEYYRQVQEALPQSDLSGVWILRPTSYHDESLFSRIGEETEKHPNIGHLDRDIG